MEPIRGGFLVKKPPESVARVWEDAPHQMSMAEWGLQWLWDQPEISVVLSGMSTMKQVQENIAAAERSAVGKLTREDNDFTGQSQRSVQELVSNSLLWLPLLHAVSKRCRHSFYF